MNEVVVRANNQGPAQTLGVSLERVLSDPDIPADKLKIVSDMLRETIAMQREEAFTSAFTRMSAVLPQIEKSGRVFDKNTKRMWDYTKIESMDRHLRPLMSEFGFSITFTTRPCPWDDKMTLHVATLLHEAGHSIESQIALPRDDGPGRNVVQSIGSSASYGRRYTWRAVLNIVWHGEDDDGVAAGAKDAPISADQVAQIRQLIAALGGDIEQRTTQVAQLGDAATIEDIRVRAFARVISVLRNKVRKQEE